jgi:hypothetical protein
VTSVQLYQTAQATADASGNASLKFPGPGLTRTWQGTVTILGSTQGTPWSISIGAQAFGLLYSPGPSGPYQLLSGQILTATTTGLMPGDQFTAILSGIDDPREEATPYTGPTIVTSVALGGP